MPISDKARAQHVFEREPEHISKSSFDRFQVAILRDLCLAKGVAVSGSGKRGSKVTKKDYISAILHRKGIVIEDEGGLRVVKPLYGLIDHSTPQALAQVAGASLLRIELIFSVDESRLDHEAIKPGEAKRPQEGDARMEIKGGEDEAEEMDVTRILWTDADADEAIGSAKATSATKMEEDEDEETTISRILRTASEFDMGVGEIAGQGSEQDVEMGVTAGGNTRLRAKKPGKRQNDWLQVISVRLYRKPRDFTHVGELTFLCGEDGSVDLDQLRLKLHPHVERLRSELGYTQCHLQVIHPDRYRPVFPYSDSDQSLNRRDVDDLLANNALRVCLAKGPKRAA